MTDKVNISSIVSSQFPSFVREDYEAFVAFVKAYYEFLQQDYNTDLKTIRDIDTTLDEYIKHFKSEYAHNIPFVIANEKFVLSNIKDLNLAKGSEAAYRLLFRLLFDKEIEIGYPGKQMLRASDGRWEQKFTIFVGVIAGNPDDIVNKRVKILSKLGDVETFVYSYKDLQITIDGKQVYELSIDRRYFGTIEPGDRVLLDSGTFTARILPTISKFKITQGGENFKVGEIYRIGTTGTILKVSKTDINGAILVAQIINYSMDEKYEGTFSYRLLSKFDEAKNLEGSSFSITVPSANLKNIGITDLTTGFSEFGSMNKFDYNVDAVAEAFPHDYAGELLRTFSSSNIVSVTDEEIAAYIEFQLGAVSKYPGYYTSNDGFLDDAMFIQDSRFYQIYSYILRVDERLDAYKAAVKTMIHPAGVAMFSEYAITNEFDLSTELESMLRVLALLFQDSVIMTESTYKLVTTTFSGDSITFSDDTLLYLNGDALYYKYIDGGDSVTFSDNPSSNLTKSETDTETMVDSGGLIWFNNYLDDMTLFDNDGSNDYMVGKTTF